jgi:hypothetical protein
MERGLTTAAGLIGGPKVEDRVPQLIFVVPGEPTDRRYFVFGARCTGCGFLELYAAGEHSASTPEV